MASYYCRVCRTIVHPTTVYVGPAMCICIDGGKEHEIYDPAPSTNGQLEDLFRPDDPPAAA
jgi:hypothetical protein